MVESDSGPNWVTVRHSEKTLKIRKIVQGETVRPSSQQTKEKKKGRGQPVVIMLYEVEDGEEMPIQAGVVAITSRAADSAAMTKAAMIAFSPSRLFIFFSTNFTSSRFTQRSISIWVLFCLCRSWRYRVLARYVVLFPTSLVQILRLTDVDGLARYCCDLVLRCCDLLSSL